MRVGLVPLLYDEYNYGGVLQFFALQKALINAEINVDIIYYSNNEKAMEEGTSIYRRMTISFKKKLYSFLHLKEKHLLDEAIYDRKRKIDNFKRKFYVKTIKETDLDYTKYAAVICGSDQIWNPNWAKRRCFLEFVPDDVNKIIYAASLGVEELSFEEANMFKQKVNRIQYVSVREHSGQRLLKKILPQKDIKVVLDPTLLLLREDWESICQENRIIDEKYILTYFLGDYSDVKNYVEQFAKKKQITVVNIPFASGERIDTENWGNIKVIDAGPDQFLELIRDAEYVITDSFHACVFSTIFQKEFYVFERDGQKSMSGRIHTLIKNLELPNRIIPRDEIIEMNRINYKNVPNRQKKLREESLRFLLRSING